MYWQEFLLLFIEDVHSHEYIGWEITTKSLYLPVKRLRKHRQHIVISLMAWPQITFTSVFHMQSCVPYISVQLNKYFVYFFETGFEKPVIHMVYYIAIGQY